MKIHFITTGGTIDKVYFDAKGQYEIGSPQIAEVLQEAHVAFEYEIEPVLAKDSLDVTDDDRRLIRDRILASGCDRIVITHGTDSMVETARALLDVPCKTIVLTGAMQPARFRDSDAVFNIGAAIGAVSGLAHGVYLVMHGCVFDPRRTHKNQEKRRFEEV